MSAFGTKRTNGGKHSLVRFWGEADKRGQLIRYLEDALALADEIEDGQTGYLIERALDEARSREFRPTRKLPAEKPRLWSKIIQQFGQNKTPPRVCRNNRGGALMLRRSSERLHPRTLPASFQSRRGLATEKTAWTGTSRLHLKSQPSPALARGFCFCGGRNPPAKKHATARR